MVHPRQSPSEGGIDAYALSPMQQGMLFHAVEGGQGVDIQQVICELPEALEPASFEQAWRGVLERHPVLRTAFEWRDREAPQQVVYPMSRVRMDFRYAEFGSELEARRGLEEYLEVDRREGFANLSAPLLRVGLIRVSGSGNEKATAGRVITRSWFVTTYHHLIIDARSMTLMFREALDLHDAIRDGKELSLPPARAYRPFIEWLQSVDLEKSQSYWRDYLKGFSAPTTLPMRSSAEAVADEGRCGELMFRLSQPVTLQLQLAAGRHGVTVNTLVQAAWSVVLSRYSGEEDVVFGALRAGRHIPVPGADQTLGLFINTVPVRVQPRNDRPLAEFLRSLRESWVAVRAHEHTPLTKVQQWSDVAPGRALFETLLNYQEPAWDAALNALGGKWAERQFDIRSRTGYPLAIDVYGGSTLTTKAFYERARFDDEMVAQLLGHFRGLLEALAAGGCEKVGELPLLSRRERTEILTTWNLTTTSYPREQCVHDFVELHADASPDRVAVSDQATQLSYRELNARANQLAHRLRSFGVGPDVLVAVCMERSVEMIVAWLGTLKAGGAFVPLDPGYPKDRLAFQVQDCGARVVLTQSHVRATLPLLAPNVSVLEVTKDGTAFMAEPDRNLAPMASAGNLAYVIYTSGSTGQPKGVQIEHRALLNLVSWHQQVYAVTAADRATHLASPAFDASVWEIWPYLTAGASVHIPDEETRLAPAALWRWMAEQKITLSFMPTPLAEAAMNEAWPASMTLRALLTGGDKLKRRPPADFPCALINHYGPTESTVVATFAAVDRDERVAASAPTIGAPIANTTTYVLDTALRPVPVGVAGELYIGGESLARGYLNRPELDAQRFVRVALESSKAAVRLYRTGDLVRWTRTGQLEFLGRIDGQVKIRGCRIELGEIETTLHGHAAVRESVVLARADDRGQLQLVAYAVLQVEGGATEVELVEFLREKLPAYMVPAALIVLSAWPLTPNGKIDRKALPAPVARGPIVNAVTAGLGTDMEQTVAKVWADVLGCPAVGREDNFFELGGHSLLAAQVVSRLNALLPTQVSVRLLFDQPTLGSFAHELETRLGTNSTPRQPLHRVKRRPSRPEMELVQSN